MLFAEFTCAETVCRTLVNIDLVVAYRVWNSGLMELIFDSGYCLKVLETEMNTAAKLSRGE